MRYLLAIAVAAALLAAWLFPRAFPVVVLSHRIAGDDARQRADSFVRAHALPAGVRTAVRFQRNDSLLTFIDLAGGGKDTVDAMVRGSDVALYAWSVRTFTPRDVHETRVHFAADGRLIGFERRFAEADVRPALAADTAQRLAEQVLTTWLREPADRWRMAAASYETRKTSERLDHTFTFERANRQIAGAPIRLDVVIAGDTPSVARGYVVIPEGFRRRYNEMRSANELFALVATVALFGFVVAGAVTLRQFGKQQLLRWREPLLTGAVIAILLAGTGLNELPVAWYGYDTAMSPATFQLFIIAGALALSALMGVIVAATLAAAEAATRAAFPDHLDWWALWRHRGTREVADRVAGGYALAAIALAYVVVFYLVTRTLFGWWVPAELLDDPNLIATPMPWLAGIAMSLQAAVWEEALFRALPLSLLSLWVGTRPRRNLWMAAGVIGTALVFGFAHSDYPSWPAYSRGVEIFLDACLWAVVFLRFGLIVTVVAHFLYNATLFGIFAATGSALPYRITAAVILLTLLAPALAVAWRWVRQRALVPAPDDIRIGAWRPAERAVASAPEVAPTATLGARARTAALVTIALGVVAALVTPERPVRGPEFTVSRSRAASIADSVARAHGIDVSQWKRLSGTNRDTLSAWTHFLRRHEAESLATSLATSYVIPSWWEVRYVRTEGPLTVREEEWRVRLRPDGVPIDVQHVVPDSAPGAKPSQAESRAIARSALVRAGAGLDSSAMHETKLEETARPARLDVTVTYTDTTVHMPAGAAARVRVSIAGGEPVLVRRAVELPETFVRENRDRVRTRMLMAALSGIILVTLVSVGATLVMRRRQPAVEDTGMSPRSFLVVVVALWVLTFASFLNELPSTFLMYDTAQPWTTFLTMMTLVSAVTSVLLVLLIAALWLAVNGLRRRVGIPMFPTGRNGREAEREALVAGAALGSLFAIAMLLRDVARSGIPSPPESVMAQAVPLFADVLSLAPSVLGPLPLIAIPLLLIAALTRKMSYRLLLAVVLLALVAGIVMPTSTGPVTPASIAVGVGAVVALAAGLRAWSSLGVVVWISAALAASALLRLQQVLHGSTGMDRWSELAAVLASLGLLAYIGKHNRRAADEALVKAGLR